MRIALYKDTLANRRGADVAVLALAEGLRERGHDAVVFEKGELGARLAEKWDVFVSTGTNEIRDVAAAFPGRFPWPVVQQFHTDPRSQFKWRKWRRNMAARAALRRVDEIQVLSEEFVPQVAKYGAKVAVIGNWSKYEDAPANGNAVFEKTIIYPAAFQSVKRQDLLIKAFARLAKDFPDWKVRFLGSADTKHAEKCKRLVARLGLEDRILFCGYCNNLEEEYGKCAFVAFPSASEGFGLVLLDAAMFYKPVIAMHDWIGTANGGGAVVVKPTVRAFAEGMRRLMSDLDACRAMGLAAHDFCAATYSRDKIIDCWVALLEGVAL